MVGCEHQQNRVLADSMCNVQRRGGYSRGRVPPKGLQNKTGRKPLGVDRGKSILGLEAQLTVGDRKQLGHARQCGPTHKGLLQQALAVGQGDEGLGVGVAGDRPQAGACTAAEDDGDEHWTTLF